MCSIAGFSGQFEGVLLDSMNAVQSHRGPDGSGLEYIPEKRIGLAHNRLAIIDLSATGHQPLWDTGKEAVIIFNGEIYNYRELRAALPSARTLLGSSDTEVLLNLYLERGPDVLKMLNGIFAFAIWDTRQDVLFVARDGMGVKPLYYCESSEGFLFASEIKAILQASCVPRDIDPVAVRHYLNYLWCPAPRTMLKSVRKLEPGHAMTVRDGRIQRMWRFYELPSEQESVPLPEPEAIRAVRDALQTAVRRQMVADVPVCALLSGGLDSSAVVSFAREFPQAAGMDCFSIEFTDETMRQEGFAEDLPYAKRVAERLGVRLHCVRAGSEMVEQLPRMVYHLEEPQADLAPIHVLSISRLAREHGAKVLLSGTGGDDIFAGYRRHYALLKERWWAWLPKSARRLLVASARLAPATQPWGRRLRKAFQYADRSEPERTTGYFHWLEHNILESLLGPLLRTAGSMDDAEHPLLACIHSLPEGCAPLYRMLYLDAKYFLADHNLNYTDKMSMAAGVEVRVPLLDPDVVALAARLPASQKVRGSTGKWVFKKAMESRLPRDVIYRPKTGFGVPLRRWIHTALRPLREELLSDTSLRARGLLDPGGVRQLIDGDQRGAVDAAYPILALMCVELWCRTFLDSRRPASIS